MLCCYLTLRSSQYLGSYLASYLACYFAFCFACYFVFQFGLFLSMPHTLNTLTITDSDLYYDVNFQDKDISWTCTASLWLCLGAMASEVVG